MTARIFVNIYIWQTVLFAWMRPSLDQNDELTNTENKYCIT